MEMCEAREVDPTNPDRLYFGTLDGQLYTSSDAGKTWQLLYNFGKPRLFVDHIIIDPTKPTCSCM